MNRFPRIVGKLVGAIVGWLLTRHPLGLVAGVALGHALDEGWLRLPGPSAGTRPSSGPKDSSSTSDGTRSQAEFGSGGKPHSGSSGNEDEERLRQSVADLESGDPYRVLQVRRDASDADIAAARRAALSSYHPDRVAASAVEIRALAERRAKAINAAYQAIMKSRGRP